MTCAIKVQGVVDPNNGSKEDGCGPNGLGPKRYLFVNVICASSVCIPSTVSLPMARSHDALPRGQLPLPFYFSLDRTVTGLKTALSQGVGAYVLCFHIFVPTVRRIICYYVVGNAKRVSNDNVSTNLLPGWCSPAACWASAACSWPRYLLKPSR